MLRNTLYDNYEIDFSDDYSKYEKAYAFVIDQNRNFYLNSEDDIEIVDVKELEEVCDVNFILYIGQYKDEPCLVANINSKTEKCGVFSVNEAYNKKRVNDYFTPLINIYDLNEDLYYVTSRAALINDWYIRNQYCGGCGCKTVVDDVDMMMKCPECGQMHYPMMAPAIIVTINNNDKLLMAKHSYHHTDAYALIAGYVEIGESIEQTVAREVKEEVGLEVENIQYVTSQAWPFPNSLMLGFTADYKSGEIKVDGNEIVDAKWFDVEKIREPKSDISISSFLIKKFIAEHSKQ